MRQRRPRVAARPVVHVRPARYVDAATILGFLKALAEYEGLGRDCRIDLARVRRHFFGRHAPVRALLATIANAPVGLCVYAPTYSTFAARPGLWIEDVFVMPEARRHGVGRALFAAAAAIATRRGCDRLAFSVLTWNRPALGFYRRLGASPVPGWTQRRIAGAALRRLADSARPRRGR
ncbi:MAG: GNAT family N-acetyltransferase [Alphaproteobacteria bacterium]|nr:GNAT family N-acetyltransferase [Alphaproteobacteria bacterium]